MSGLFADPCSRPWQCLHILSIVILKKYRQNAFLSSSMTTLHVPENANKSLFPTPITHISLSFFSLSVRNSSFFLHLHPGVKCPSSRFDTRYRDTWYNLTPKTPSLCDVLALREHLQSFLSHLSPLIFVLLLPLASLTVSTVETEMYVSIHLAFHSATSV